MDKYGTEQDPACYTGTDVLINHLNITDADTLEIAERDITEIAAAQIEFTSPPYDFDFLKQLHLKLFEDIYPWAGQLRTVDVAKGATRFCTASRIDPEARKLFGTLSENSWFAHHTKMELITAIAEFCGDLNIIHPFREGNGRTLRLLCEFIVINTGYEIDWNPVPTDLWLQASIDSVTCDYQAMNRVFELCIGNPIAD